MDKTSLIDKVKQMANKRDYLLQLRDKPDIGGLRLDVNQALEEKKDNRQLTDNW